MTDLIQTLYTFAYEHRVMAYLHDDTEYHDARRCAGLKESALRSVLSREQESHLDDMLAEQQIYLSAEEEAIFQAGFFMALELFFHS